jgi:hypothetical protein
MASSALMVLMARGDIPNPRQVDEAIFFFHLLYSPKVGGKGKEGSLSR